MIEYGKLPNMAAFKAWQGEDYHPAPGTVNHILGLQYEKAISRYTSPITKLCCDEVYFIVDRNCPIKKLNELFSLMGEDQLYNNADLVRDGY